MVGEISLLEFHAYPVIFTGASDLKPFVDRYKHHLHQIIPRTNVYQTVTKRPVVIIFKTRWTITN